ncbi:MAG: hypothetical protein WAM71_17395 [Candidatus Korobacteraceae bacterium]
MVDLDVSEGKLLVSVRGADKVWALKSSLEIPLEHITSIRTDPTIAKGWWHGLKSPGTHVPGVITAGTYYTRHQKTFWDIHNPDRAIVIELRDESYDRLVVEVADPESAIALIESVSGND